MLDYHLVELLLRTNKKIFYIYKNQINTKKFMRSRFRKDLQHILPSSN